MQSHEDEAEALERCLAHLKKDFTPLELDELLEMKSEHDLENTAGADGASPQFDTEEGETVAGALRHQQGACMSSLSLMPRSL